MYVTCTPYKRAFSNVCLVSGRGGSRKVKRPTYSSIYNNKYAFTYNEVKYSSIVLYIYTLYIIHYIGISNIIRIHLSYTTQCTAIYSI